jgi:hypothetical protein
MDRTATARAHPVVVVSDLAESDPPKASGRVRLPLRVRWSDPSMEYDLANPRHIRRVYEQVLREGTAEDVRFYIRPSVLVAIWDDLFLPSHVRDAWDGWIVAQRDSG